jgi:alpha-L-arabinofuranosidase
VLCACTIDDIRLRMAARITVIPSEQIGRINPELHGQFAEHLGCCVNNGLWVGERSKISNVGGFRADVLEALRRLRIPVLRWPGGCFADDYHWEDGVGPRDQRPARFNGWWGHTIEDNQFGTHEFIALCRYLGAQPYLAGNVGSGTPREMKHWVEYCNFTGPTALARRRAQNGAPQPFDVTYWGVGNENWGCGGSMQPEDYAALYKQFATFLSTFMRAPTHMPLYLIACGPNGNGVDWTTRFFRKAGAPAGDWRLSAFAAHYYCGTAGTATAYTPDQWYELLHKATYVDQLISDQRRAMDEVDPQHKIDLIIDEWGTWHPPAPGRNAAHLWQQNTLRDALVAAITLDTFHRRCDVVKMANIAQVVNVLQAMVLAEGDHMVLTPTYHVFEMYQSHQGATAVRAEFDSSPVRFAANNQRQQLAGLSGSASVNSGVLTLTTVNPHATLPVEVEVEVHGVVARDATVTTLSHEDITAHNTFDEPEVVRPKLPRSATLPTLTLPPASVSRLQLRL